MLSHVCSFCRCFLIFAAIAHVFPYYIMFACIYSYYLTLLIFGNNCLYLSYLLKCLVFACPHIYQSVTNHARSALTSYVSMFHVGASNSNVANLHKYRPLTEIMVFLNKGFFSIRGFLQISRARQNRETPDF